jgi:long-chain acyl-CoA synthetase
MHTGLTMEDSQKVWLASYPPGVPAEVEWRATPSLKHLVERSCGRFADKPAFTSLGVHLSYADVERHSRHFAAWLRAPCARA